MYDLGFDIPFAVLWFRRGRSIEAVLYILEVANLVQGFLVGCPLSRRLCTVLGFSLSGISFIKIQSLWLVADNETSGKLSDEFAKFRHEMLDLAWC